MASSPYVTSGSGADLSATQGELQMVGARVRKCQCRVTTSPSKIKDIQEETENCRTALVSLQRSLEGVSDENMQRDFRILRRDYKCLVNRIACVRSLQQARVPSAPSTSADPTKPTVPPHFPSSAGAVKPAPLDTGLESCPTIAELHGRGLQSVSMSDFIRRNPPGRLSTEHRLPPGAGTPLIMRKGLLIMSPALLTADDAFYRIDEGNRITTDLDTWVVGVRSEKGKEANYIDFVDISYHDTFYPHAHPKKSLHYRIHAEESSHAISLTLRKSGDVTTVALFDPHGIAALDSSKREYFITLHNFLKSWALSKGFSFVSLPELNVKMQFPGATWELDGVCAMFNGLYMYLTAMGKTPEAIKQLMVDLGHEGREKIVRQFAKYFISPTSENRISFNRIIDSLIP